MKNTFKLSLAFVAILMVTSVVAVDSRDEMERVMGQKGSGKMKGAMGKMKGDMDQMKGVKGKMKGAMKRKREKRKNISFMLNKCADEFEKEMQDPKVVSACIKMMREESAKRVQKKGRKGDNCNCRN